MEINLTKEVKDFYYQNFSILKKKLEKTLKDRKTYHVHGLVELTLSVTKSDLSILYNLYKILIIFFTELEKEILNDIWKRRRHRITKQC